MNHGCGGKLIFRPCHIVMDGNVASEGMRRSLSACEVWTALNRFHEARTTA